ncbi:MAG: hypothetical protein JSS90_02600 [Bacteroidetes bacterium]|jgi:hypothetical protein|nr:hypothetical protein [Bacteroidota bacterium]
MKKSFLLLLFVSLIFSGCTKYYIQIFDTLPKEGQSNIKLDNEYYEYESDTLKIVYEFWASRGVMAFSIYNKTGAPIYIDWKKSSFIYNSKKLNYWNDEQTTNSVGLSYEKGYYYNGPLVLPGFGLYEGYKMEASKAKTTKPERVAMIPPHSYIYPDINFSLFNDFKFRFGDRTFALITNRNDIPSEKTIEYTEEFNYQLSPIKFRNFLAFSFSDENPSFFFIENEFYVNSVKEMEYKHYRGKVVKTSNGVEVYSKPLKSKHKFYIDLKNSERTRFKK